MSGCRYVRSHFGDNCFYRDSSFKRYNRAHCGGDIINFNYNYGNNCCGGHGSFGFWGGFGAGLGMGLCNLFMGGMNMLGGWFGGGNYWGGGAPSWMGLGGTAQSDAADRAARRVARRNRGNDTVRTETVRTEPINDKDRDVLDGYLKDIAALRARQDNGEDVSKEAAALKARIEASKANKLDDINTDSNDLEFDNYSKDCKGLIKNPPPVAPATPAEDEVVVDGKPVKITALTPEQIDKLLSGVKDLSADDKKALANKLKAGLDSLKKSEGVYKFSPDFTTLKKLELLCALDPSIVVDAEHRTASADQWIKGSISGVKMEDGKITYTVDCKNTGVAEKGKYTFQQQTANDDKYWICNMALDSEGKENTKWNKDKNIVYEYDSGSGCIINKTNYPTIRYQ